MGFITRGVYLDGAQWGKSLVQSSATPTKMLKHVDVIFSSVQYSACISMYLLI